VNRTREPKWLAPALLALAAAAIAGLAWPELAPWVLFAVSLLGPVAAILVSRVMRSRPAAPMLGEEIRARAITSQEQFDVLARGLDDGILEAAPDGTIVFANEAAERLLGRPSLIGVQVRELGEGFMAATRQAKGVSEPTFRVEFDHGDRALLVRSWSESDHGPDRIFLHLQDVTELRHLETVRRDFVANVSHELRTPMTTIRAMSETLLDDDTNDQALKERYLSRVIAEIDRLTRITEDLLVLSIAESQTKAHVPFDLSELVAGVVSQLRAKSEAKSLDLHHEIEPGALISGNESQIVQVVVNLIDNAINYTSEGQVSVAVEITPSECLLTVADTGIGIPAEDLSRVFERFYRVDKGRSRSTGGTGLGLSIVRNIVEAHGGRVTVSSILGQGTTFVVTLPRVEDTSGI